MSREESITRKVSQLTNQIRRDIKKTNDPSEMEADKCVFFSPDFPTPSSPSSLPRPLAACSRLTSMNRGSDNRRNGSSVRSEGPWDEVADEEEPVNEVRDRRREERQGRKIGEGRGKVDEYENYSPWMHVRGAHLSRWRMELIKLSPHLPRRR